MKQFPSGQDSSQPAPPQNVGQKVARVQPESSSSTLHEQQEIMTQTPLPNQMLGKRKLDVSADMTDDQKRAKMSANNVVSDFTNDKESLKKSVDIIRSTYLSPNTQYNQSEIDECFAQYLGIDCSQFEKLCSEIIKPTGITPSLKRDIVVTLLYQYLNLGSKRISQSEIAGLFGKSRAWVSQIVQKYYNEVDHLPKVQVSSNSSINLEDQQELAPQNDVGTYNTSTQSPQAPSNASSLSDGCVELQRVNYPIWERRPVCPRRATGVSGPIGSMDVGPGDQFQRTAIEGANTQLGLPAKRRYPVVEPEQVQALDLSVTKSKRRYLGKDRCVEPQNSNHPMDWKLSSSLRETIAPMTIIENASIQQLQINYGHKHLGICSSNYTC